MDNLVGEILPHEQYLTITSGNLQEEISLRAVAWRRNEMAPVRTCLFLRLLELVVLKCVASVPWLLTSPSDNDSDSPSSLGGEECRDLPEDRLSL